MFGWCLVIAIIVFIIAANDRQNKKVIEDEVRIDIEKTLEDIENRDVVNNRISELRKIRQEKELLEHREKLEQERLAEAKRVEEERLAKIEADRVAKAKKDKEAKQSQVVASNTPSANRSGGGRNLGTFQVTSYCGCSICNGKYVGQPTASGTQMQQGRTIAVDPNIIPLGSKVSVNGHIYTAEDTGSAIKGKIIDIYYNSHSAALKFGRQNVTVKILD